MTDPADAQSDLDLSASRRFSAWRPSRPTVLLGLQLSVAGAMVILGLWSGPTGAIGIIEMILAVLVLLSVVVSATRSAAMEEGLARLQALLPEVRAGREPIESLSQVSKPVAALAGLCQELARDIRQERVRIAQLEDEVRLRVAGRTEALERTIGTLRQQAARDSLTGLFNRRMLDAYLPEAVARCTAASAPLCLLMIDVDYFKNLNDTLGHASGDTMLRAIAQLMRSTIRETDLAFRNGGDEFVIVLENCTPEDGQSKAARLSSLGAALGRTYRLTPPPNLSVGLTMLSDMRNGSAPELLRLADEALYLVKAQHHAAVAAAGATRRSA